MNKKGGGIFAGLLDFLRRVFAKNTPIEISAKKPNKNENEHSKPSKGQGKQSTEKSNAQQQKFVVQNDLNNQKTRAQNNFKEQQSDAQNKAESQQTAQSKGMDSKQSQSSSKLQQSQQSLQSQQSAQQEQWGTLQKQHNASQSASQNANHTNETNSTNGDSNNLNDLQLNKSNNLDNSQSNKNDEGNGSQDQKIPAESTSSTRNSQENKVSAGAKEPREAGNSTKGGANNQHDLNSPDESCSPKAADSENQCENSTGNQRNGTQDVDLDKLKEKLRQLIGDYINNPSQWTHSQSDLQPESQQSKGDNKTENAQNGIDNISQTSRSQANNNLDNSRNQVGKMGENPNIQDENDGNQCKNDNNQGKNGENITDNSHTPLNNSNNTAQNVFESPNTNNQRQQESTSGVGQSLNNDVVCNNSSASDRGSDKGAHNNETTDGDEDIHNNNIGKSNKTTHNDNTGDSKVHGNNIGRPIENKTVNQLIDKLSSFTHENGAYDTNGSPSNNDAKNKNEQDCASDDASSTNSKGSGGILPRTVFSKNHVSGNTIDMGDGNLSQTSNPNQSRNSNQNENLNSNANSNPNGGSEQNNEGLQDESCNRVDHDKSKSGTQNGNSQENSGENLSSGTSNSGDLNNKIDNNDDSAGNDANSPEIGNEIEENANTSASNAPSDATPQNSSTQQNPSKTRLNMINTYHMNLSKNLVPYGDLEQDEEKVNEIIVKTVVNNFFKMRFKSTRSNLNTRDSSGEKVQGYAKWDAKKIVLHKSTKEYNKMLQDKCDYKYSSGKREQVPLAIYLDLSVSMNNYIPMLLTIALQFLKNDVTVIIGANAAATVQINSVSNSITRDELVSIVNDEKCTSNTKCTPLNSIDICEYLVSKKAEKALIFSDYDTLTSVAKLSNTDCQVYWFNTKGVKNAELKRFNFNGAIQSISNQNDIIKAIVEFTKHNYSGVRYRTQDALSCDK